MKKINPYKLESRGNKYISFQEGIKDILKTHSHIEFDWKGKKFAIIKFDDFIRLLKKWRKER